MPTDMLEMQLEHQIAQIILDAIDETSLAEVCAKEMEKARSIFSDIEDPIVRDVVSFAYQLGGKTSIENASKWWNNYQGGAYWSGYECYITGMRDVIGLRLPIHDAYAWWEKAAIAAPFRVMHEKFCIVSDFPLSITADDENRPHGENGPSHHWRDGWKLYHWHGTRIPGEWIEDKENMKPEIALTWSNIEQRRAASEIIGWDKVLDQLNATVIDEHQNPQVGTLVEVDLPDVGRERFLRVRCGTGRNFSLPVPPEMSTALEAQAWTWGIDPKEFKVPEVRT